MKINYKWSLIVTILAFTISLVMSFISTMVLENVNLVIAILVTFLFILLGIIFDIIGVSVTSGDEVAFHSMSARKVRGAKTAVTLKKNAEKVSSFCNDVIGDICGIVSGSLGAALTLDIIGVFNASSVIITMIVTATISSLTVGFKAIFKDVAEKNSDAIVYTSGKILSIFKKEK